jgi:hypothetical protein
MNSSERAAWTKFVEQRERARKVKRPRARKPPLFTPAKLEAALDDLVDEAKARTDKAGGRLGV